MCCWDTHFVPIIAAGIRSYLLWLMESEQTWADMRLLKMWRGELKAISSHVIRLYQRPLKTG